MKTFFKTLKQIIFMTVVLSISMCFSVLAATAKIQFSDPTVKRGKQIDLTMKVKSEDARLASVDVSVSYDPNMIEFVSGANGTTAEGGAGTVRITGAGKGANTRTLEYHLTFDAKQSGTTEVKLETNEVKDSNDNIVNITHFGSSKITIKPANTTSKNANLKSLVIQPGELDKTFDPAVLEYNADVNSDILQLVITAEPEDSDAKIVITGNENFVVGNNNVVINVTAANNTTTKTYTLHVNKLDTGFTAGDTELAGSDTRAVSQQLRVTILPLPDNWKDDFPNYSVTQATLGENSSLVDVLGQNTEIEASRNSTANTLTNCIFYGIGPDGEARYYRYDNVQYTIQRYIAEQTDTRSATLQQEYDKLYEEYQVAYRNNRLLFIGLVASLVLLLIMVVILIIKIRSGSKNRYSDDDYDDDDYDDEEEDDDTYFSHKDNKLDKDLEDDAEDEFVNQERKYDHKKNKNIEDYDDEEDDEIEELI